MRPVFVGVFLLASVLGSAQSRFVVVPNPQGSAAEKHASETLAKYLTQITGQPVAVSPTAKATTRILVGATPEVRKLCPDIDWDKLGMEEVVMRKVGNDLVLAGGKPRGTIYSAYRFLGRLGVRWWTPWAIDVPHDANLVIPNLNVREAPAFEYRDPYWKDAFDLEWQVANCVNGPLTPNDEAHGGRVEYEGFVHTYYGYAVPEKDFATHPEWFSLINGQRVNHDAQLCTTNPELQRHILAQVRERLRKNPKATIVSVSQNDCYNPCQCDRCQALARAEGSESAPVLDLANYVADGIKDEFPNVAVDTLAYQYTRHAPRTLRPRPNVIVRLCSIECDFGVPFTDPKNKDFATDIRDWSRLTQRLYIWDYATNFANYVQPFPNVHVLGPNLKFFSENGVKGVFEEGDYNSTGGEMAEIKAWMMAQLMWDPKQDPMALRSEFLKGYFGPYADDVATYLDRFAKEASAHPVHVFDGTDAAYLHLDGLVDNFRVQPFGGPPAYANRFQYAYLPVQYVQLKRWKEYCSQVPTRSRRWPAPGQRKALADQWLERALNPGVGANPPMTAISEGGMPPAQFVPQVSGDIAPPPTRHAATPPAGVVRGWIDAQDNLARLWNEPDGASFFADAKASDGAACRMPGTHHEWAFQLPIEKISPDLRYGKWRVFVVARVDADGDEPIAFTTGIYSDDARADVRTLTVHGGDATNTYQAYELGVFNVPAHGSVWVAPPADGRVRAVWVDRVYFVPVQG